MFRIVLLLFAGIGAGYLLRNWSFVARLERGVSLTVWALLFVFGVTIGSNRELIANFGRFGWQAAVIASLASPGVSRWYSSSGVTFSGKEGAMRDSLIVFVFFAVGVALGYADAVPTWLLDPDLPMIILSVMVVLVSLGLGAGDNLHYMLRTFNWRMLLLPLCTIVGTLLFSALGVLVLRGFSLTDCLAVGSGFGYYSLSSVLIADLKSATLGVQGAAELATVALLANVVREMIALFGMPLFARWGGPLAPISVSGVTSMDVCLPSIARYSGSDLVPLAILHGIVLEVCVPILVGAFC